MSYRALRNALLKMPPTGEQGFEGLIATLLSALTGYRFYVARSGDQPADVVSSEGDIAIQGKRYDKTRFDETEFEGDFQKACRLCPKLDCYVLAATRTTGQLTTLADQLQSLTAVDILLLEFSTADSDLPALCLSYWEKVRHFPQFSQLDTTFAQWAAAEAARPAMRATLDQLRASLTRSVPLAATVRRQLKAYLDVRFQINSSSGRPSRFPIDLPHSVARVEPRRQLVEWWKDAKTRAAVITAEEGMGKSWVAADCTVRLIESDEVLVLWLDSADWAGLRTIEEVVDAGFKQAGFSDPSQLKRLVRKALTRWLDRFLVILDGVNERGARDTAQRLLAQLHTAQVAPCRLLFTTRPIAWASDECRLWNAATQVPIGRFTEKELKDALAGLAPSIPRCELPSGLVEVATIPRYFRTGVALRTRFKTLANVSKEMVLWADLLAKVEAGDPQVTTQIGWTSPGDVKRALLKLASAARAIQTNARGTTDSYSLLQSCFGEKFEQIRFDLAEQRVVLEPSSENPAPSPEHVVLGFALHLGSIAGKHPADSVSELADRLRRELEPVFSQDQLTEALFVALQLSAFRSAEGHTLSSRARAALLLAWASSQNLSVEALRLSFWASQDIIAYLDFVEEVFVEPVSDGWSDVIVAPLLELWRESALKTPQLDARLHRWLKLIWRSHDFTSEPEITVDGQPLPTARSQQQLALSFVALAALSEMPPDLFLPDLAIAWATASMSTERHSWPKQPGGDVVEVHDFHCKELDYNLGALLRWRYTETVKPNIELLRASHSTDELMVKGFDYMIRAFDQFGWTRGSIPEARLRDKKPYFPADRSLCQNRVLDGPELAVRDDLPDLCANDQEVIAEKVGLVFSSQGLHSGYERTHEDFELEYHLSWFAKYRVEGLIQLGTRFHLACLDLREIAPALTFANGLPFAASVIAPGDLLTKAKAWVDRGYTGSEQRLSWSLLQLHVLALVCFPEPQLKDWWIFASGRKRLRREIHFYPVPILCPPLLSNALASFVREQARRCCDEPADESDVSESEFDFWAYIGGLAGQPDLEFNAWATAQIRSRQPQGKRRYYWLLLWFRSAPEPVLKEAVSNGSIMQFLADEGLWPLTSAGRSLSDWGKLPTDFDPLAKVLPIDDLGTLLANADRTADLAKWGHLVFNQAIEIVANPPFDRSFWGATIYELGDTGEISGSGSDREEGPGDSSAEALRPKPQQPLAMLLNPVHFEEEERRANEGLHIWREDQERLKKAGLDAFGRFEARRALREWRDQNPALFCNYAKKLLTLAASQPGKAFHLGGFIECVLDALIPLEPDFSLQTDAALRSGSLRVNIINEYGVSTFTAEFWRAAANGNSRCQEVCDRFVHDSATDEELMYQAITAQAEGAQEVLLSICNRLLRAPLARDRCLAVSLLAWVPDENQIERLEQLITRDPSGWVQKHAEWAVECAKQEASVRRYYERTLKEVDRNVVQAHLQVMLPALTPAARWWHRDIELKRSVADSVRRDVQAALAFFWYDTRSECKKTPKPFGRALNEYLRGERIRDLRSPKPRLLDAMPSGR